MGKTIPPRDVRFLIWLGVAALAGTAFFGFVAWRSITLEVVEPEVARARFAEVRSRFGPVEPVLKVDEQGGVRRRPPTDVTRPEAKRLYVMAYFAPPSRLATTDSPFWFLKMKGPGFEYAFRDTGFDLERLGVTPAELEKYGACLILDETRANGDRLLVWTQ